MVDADKRGAVELAVSNVGNASMVSCFLEETVMLTSSEPLMSLAVFSTVSESEFIILIFSVVVTSYLVITIKAVFVVIAKFSHKQLFVLHFLWQE